MAVSSVTELRDRSGSYTINSEGIDRKYTRTFQVIMTSKNDGAYLAMAAPGFTLLDFYATSTESDLLAVVTSVSTQCVSDDGHNWETVVEYGPWPFDTTSQDPTEWPIEIEWSFAKFQRPVDETVTGEAIVNSAGDPFAEAVQRDDSRAVLSVKRRQASFNSALAWQVVDTVNADPFLGAPPRTVKCSNINGSYNSKNEFWDVDYEFEFRADGWAVKLLDQGYRELDGSELKPITVKGKPVNDPHLLNGAGAKLNPNGTPVFGTFNIYPQVPFSIFNF